jgi:hypothetical protein
MYNRILAFRPGEVSYVYLLRKKEDLSSAEETTTLIIAKIFDYIMISFLFLIGTLLPYDSLSSKVKSGTLIMSAFLFISFAILFYLTLRGNQAMRVIEAILNKSGLLKINFFDMILIKGREMVESFQVIASRETYFFTFLCFVLWPVGLRLPVYR